MNAEEDATDRRTWLARLRRGPAWIKANRKNLFWLWIAYQSLKGAATLSLIWIPILILWLNR
jgi:hypothetical protein